MTGEWIVWSYTAAFYETGDIVSFASALLSLLPIFIVIFLAGLASASRYPRQDAALVLLLALCQNTVLNAILKKVLKMPRPHHYLRRSGEIGAPSSHGMPSDHAQFMFFFVTWLLRKAHANKIPVPVGMQLFLLGAATLVACGRVYNSFHTVAQVVVGAIVGIVNAYTLSSTFGESLLLHTARIVSPVRDLCTAWVPYVG
ncbi:putative PAP2 superfamily [Trypanosoma vivax]|uniref:Putative PAP2 family protein n=1 Tax=Trypanosoma vivax (strain Y486) TaxID=1055687 RepID=G0TWJ7_TRYVY|nr:putative PAP2 superfamily [Trypanosoma vivax]CCC48335.1 putative PAP2 family protein [Trypanosoma vivax Y486]